MTFRCADAGLEQVKNAIRCDMQECDMMRGAQLERHIRAVMDTVLRVYQMTAII